MKTGTEILHELLIELGQSSRNLPVVRPDTVDGLPEDILALFLEKGLLKEIAYTDHVICDGCHQNCLMPVERMPLNGKASRLVVVCDKDENMGRITIEASRLRRWRIDPLGLCRVIGEVLCTNNHTQEIVSDTFWDLGSAQIKNVDYNFYLHRDRVNLDDKAKIDELIHHQTKALNIILTLSIQQISKYELEFVSILELAKYLSISNYRVIFDFNKLERHLFSQDGIFTQDGFYSFKDFWILSFSGRMEVFKNTKGMQYLAFLLKFPLQPFDILDLARFTEKVNLVKSKTEIDQIKHEIAGTEALTVQNLDLKEKKISDEDQNKLNKRAQYLFSRLTEARNMQDEEQVSEIEREMEKLTKEIEQRAKQRTISPEVEKARVNITTQIGSVKSSIKEAFPDISQYLSDTVKTGQVCIYIPDENNQISKLFLPSKLI